MPQKIFVWIAALAVSGSPVSRVLAAALFVTRSVLAFSSASTFARSSNSAAKRASVSRRRSSASAASRALRTFSAVFCALRRS
jgi:hypothetical protein